MAEPRGVFVSYRRDSTAHLADRIGETLKNAFENVFVDVATIDPGLMFATGPGIKQ